jgi:hypothetical protein
MAKQIINEEFRRMQELAGINEGKEIKLKYWGLRTSEDGRFSGSPDVYIESVSEDEAKELANEYTGGQFTEFPGFYELRPISLNIYKK